MPDAHRWAAKNATESVQASRRRRCAMNQEVFKWRVLVAAGGVCEDLPRPLGDRRLFLLDERPGRAFMRLAGSASPRMGPGPPSRIPGAVIGTSRGDVTAVERVGARGCWQVRRPRLCPASFPSLTGCWVELAAFGCAGVANPGIEDPGLHFDHAVFALGRLGVGWSG